MTLPDLRGIQASPFLPLEETDALVGIEGHFCQAAPSQFELTDPSLEHDSSDPAMTHSPQMPTHIPHHSLSFAIRP
jgi:hypothetical protein